MMSKSTKAEDNKKAIKKKLVKTKANEFMIEHHSSYPNKPIAERAEYRVDYGVRCYQIPAESTSSTKVLERVIVRRTWCIKQRQLWLEEVVCNPLTLASGGLPCRSGDPTPNLTGGVDPAGAGAAEPVAVETLEYNLLSNFARRLDSYRSGRKEVRCHYVLLLRAAYWQRIRGRETDRTQGAYLSELAAHA